MVVLQVGWRGRGLSLAARGSAGQGGPGQVRRRAVAKGLAQPGGHFQLHRLARRHAAGQRVAVRFFVGADMGAADRPERLHGPRDDAHLAHAAATVHAAHRNALAPQAQHAGQQALIGGAGIVFPGLEHLYKYLARRAGVASCSSAQQGLCIHFRMAVH